MAQKIQLKRSAVAGKVPTTSDLELGELALNTYDGKLYTKKSVSGVDSIVELSSSELSSSVTTSDAAPSSPGDGDLWYDSVGGRLYVYYDDGNSSQWVDAAPPSGAGVPTKIEVGNTKAEVTDTGSNGAFAVTTEGTERLRVDSSGRVGIGTTSASAKLDIAHGNELGIYTSGPYNFQAKFESTDPEAAIIIEDSNSTNDGNRIGVIGDNMTFTTANSERARIDSSGRLLVGQSSSAIFTPLEVNGNGSFGNYLDNDFCSGLRLYKSKSGTTGTQGLVANNSQLGDIRFLGSDGSSFVQGAVIRAEVDGTPGSNDMPGRLVFSTTADGASSPTERMRIKNGGTISMPGVYSLTTASAANVFVASDGDLARSTSSSKYKTDIETLQDSYADAILNVRPVWYRSTCDGDNPNYGWWGFIAEEVAEIDPRLVHWKTTEPVVQENGSLEHVPCDPEPEGVAYDRFVPHLLNLIKRQKEQIEAQGTALAALEARLSALEAS